MSSNLPAVTSRQAPRPGIATRLKRGFQAIMTGEVARHDLDAGLRRFLEASYTTSSGAVVNERTAMTVGTVFACVRIIAQTFASVEFRVYQLDGDREIVADWHDVDRALNVQ
ncbi:MAG: hypothetical protein ACLFPA_12630, partial [Dichotomicrobium sp.]